MDDDTLLGDGGLFPELAAIESALPRWEVTFQVRRRDGGEPLVPIGVPSGAPAIACWTAAEGVAGAIVPAPDEAVAKAAGARACRGWAELPDVTVTVGQATAPTGSRAGRPDRAYSRSGFGRAPHSRSAALARA